MAVTEDNKEMDYAKQSRVNRLKSAITVCKNAHFSSNFSCLQQEKQKLRWYEENNT